MLAVGLGGGFRRPSSLVIAWASVIWLAHRRRLTPTKIDIAMCNRGHLHDCHLQRREFVVPGRPRPSRLPPSGTGSEAKVSDG